MTEFQRVHHGFINQRHLSGGGNQNGSSCEWIWNYVYNNKFTLYCIFHATQKKIIHGYRHAAWLRTINCSIYIWPNPLKRSLLISCESCFLISTPALARAVFISYDNKIASTSPSWFILWELQLLYFSLYQYLKAELSKSSAKIVNGHIE